MTVLATLHVPERLEGETQDEYRARRRWSKLLGAQMLPVTQLPLQHRTDAVRIEQRELTAAIGKRQAIKARKFARRARKEMSQ